MSEEADYFNFGTRFPYTIKNQEKDWVKVLDENERSAGLKQQYIEKIDPSIEKYSIDHLFEDIEYGK